MSYKVNFNYGWNAGARSRKVCFGDCQVNFSVPTTNSGAVVGFNNADNGPTFTEILYAFFLQKTPGGPVVYIYESGVEKYIGGAYADADIFTIRRNGTIISYLQNGTLLYTSATPSTGALFVDTSLYAGGDRV